MSAAERHVILGLATVRSEWFTQVARWSTVGAIPVEFVKCISVEELRSRLDSGRPHSGLLIDSGCAGLDRDLIDRSTRVGTPVIVVGPPNPRWLTLGAAATLPSVVRRDELVAAITSHLRPVRTLDTGIEPGPDSPATEGTAGPLITVLGGGGSGVSTLAIALAQGLADTGSDVVLADLCLDADQAVLHDPGEVGPGVQELVEAHGRSAPSAAEVRALTHEVVARRYHLLLGLRRHEDWATLRPRRVDAALDGLARAFSVTVADLDSDLEGEAATGSVEVEERNLLARTAVSRATVIWVVGRADTTGLHGLVRSVSRLRRHGVDDARIQMVVNRAPRRPSRRAEITRTLADLTGAGGDRPLRPPLQVGEQRGLDSAVRDGVRLPAAWADRLRAAAEEHLASVGPSSVTAGTQPVAVVPGRLGSWSPAVVR